MPITILKKEKSTKLAIAQPIGLSLSKGPFGGLGGAAVTRGVIASFTAGSSPTIPSAFAHVRQDQRLIAIRVDSAPPAARLGPGGDHPRPLHGCIRGPVLIDIPPGRSQNLIIVHTGRRANPLDRLSQRTFRRHQRKDRRSRPSGAGCPSDPCRAFRQHRASA